jgi:hypothetical protein
VGPSGSTTSTINLGTTDYILTRPFTSLVGTLNVIASATASLVFAAGGTVTGNGALLRTSAPAAVAGALDIASPLFNVSITVASGNSFNLTSSASGTLAGTAVSAAGGTLALQTGVITGTLALSGAGSLILSGCTVTTPTTITTTVVRTSCRASYFPVSASLTFFLA